MDKIDAEKIFQLEGSYTLGDVKHRYAELVLKYHPDTVQDVVRKREYTNYMFDINSANRFLRSQFSSWCSVVVSDWVAPVVGLTVSPVSVVFPVETAVESVADEERPAPVYMTEPDNTSVRRSAKHSILSVLRRVPYCVLTVLVLLVCVLNLLCDGNWSLYLDSSSYGVLFSADHTFYLISVSLLICSFLPAVWFDLAHSFGASQS